MATATLTYNGLTIGVGSDFRVVELEGLWETPDVRTSDVDRARAHGQWAGVDLLGGRAITATVQANADLGDPAWGTLQQALRATGPELPLSVELSGYANGRALVANARVRRLAVPVDVERYQFGVPRVVVEWWATDPRLYDAQLTTASAQVSAPTGTGLVFDATFDLYFYDPNDGPPVVPSGVVSVSNDGNFSAPWVAEIAGPVTDPRIENVTTGQTLRFRGTVNGGQVLRVDSQARSVTLDGGSRYSWLLPRSRWFDVVPGVNQVRFAAVGGTGAGTLTFRSAWI
jgi:hypothetical protein